MTREEAKAKAIEKVRELGLSYNNEYRASYSVKTKKGYKITVEYKEKKEYPHYVKYIQINN